MWKYTRIIYQRSHSLQEAVDGLDMPLLALVTVGRHLAAVQLVPDGANRAEPLRPQGLDQGLHAPGEFNGGIRVPLALDVPSVLPQLDAAALGRLQGVAGADADLLPLVFGEGGQQVHHELVGVGVVDGLEIHPAFHQVGDEGHIAAQTVKLGDDEQGLLPAALGQGGQKLQALVLAAALDLGVMGGDLVTLPVGEQADRFLLGLQAQAAFALAVGGHAVVGDGSLHGANIVICSHFVPIHTVVCIGTETVLKSKIPPKS